jgi:arylsulfatase A-like enzyme/Tfp pilus assembly protein PilF
MPNGRRSAAGVLVVAFLAVAIAAWWWLEDPSRIAFTRQPDQNVLLITIDTLRADALGCYGGAATPAIDALASRGVRYDFAHAHAVVTLPSHASILTGLYPFQHGIRDNSGFRLEPGTPTVATAVKKAGFTTAAFVGAFPLDARFGLTSGFDVYDDGYADAGRSVEFAIPERKAEEVVRAAREWISTQRGRWFAWVHLFDPHAAYEPPSPFDKEYVSNPYWGEVAYTDRALSPLLSDLDAQQRDTVVIVTADHGEAMGDHNEVTHGLFAYEATLRVPLIVAQLEGSGAATSAPEATVERRGEVSTVAARHVDLAPTILDLVRVDAPSGLAGRSLVGVDGRALRPDGDDERTSYFEAMSASLNRGWAPLSGVLAGREKLIALPLPELYDLQADPREATNLIDTRGERRRALEARLNAFGASGSPLRRVDESPDALARLRALGYVSGSAPRKDRYTETDDPKRLIDLDRMIHEGVELYQRGLPSQAEQMYARLLQRRPDMALAYKHLAALQWETGRPADAVHTLERALEAGAADAGMRAQLGIYLAESGHPGKAIPLLEIATPSGGTASSAPDPDALNALGIAYARGGRLGDALRAFERVLSSDPGNSMALENIGSTKLSMRDTAGARAALLRASELNPRSARAQVGLGAVEMAAGNRDAAFAHWRRAVELDPSDLEALYNLATGLAAASRRDEARRYAEAFVRQAPPARFARELAELAPLAR